MTRILSFVLQDRLKALERLKAVYIDPPKKKDKNLLTNEYALKFRVMTKKLFHPLLNGGRFPKANTEIGCLMHHY